MGIYHPQEEISLLPACPPRAHLAPYSRSALLLHHFLPVVVTAHVHGMVKAQPRLNSQLRAGYEEWGKVRLMLCSISGYDQVVPSPCSW